MSRTTKEVDRKTTTENWMQLARVTLSRLITFNKRRGNAAAQMLVDKYVHRPNWQNANRELVDSLKPIEKALMKR